MDWKTEICERHLYVLQLVDEKFYVGQAKKPEKRIKKHFAGTGSEWTKKHTPLRVIRRESLGTLDYRAGELAENEIVVALMREHGYQNVRGGFYTNLSPEMIAKGLINHGHADVVQSWTSAGDGTLEQSAEAALSLITSEYFLFVLRLTGGKYFIGFSSNPASRIARHFAGKAADWTSLHKPIEAIIERPLGLITTSAAAHIAAEETVSWMKTAGWENVRGGPYNRLDSAAHQKMLEAQGLEHLFREPPQRVAPAGDF